MNTTQSREELDSRIRTIWIISWNELSLALSPQSLNGLLQHPQLNAIKLYQKCERVALNRHTGYGIGTQS